MHKRALSIVIPAYNESVNIRTTCLDVAKAIPSRYEYSIIVVDDGSRDDTLHTARELNKLNSNIKVVALSRNFGKEIATSAGIYYATGDATIILDADGQHPPELIPDFLSRWEKGAQVVIGVRASNTNEGPVKKYGSKLFYILLNRFAGAKIVPASTDYRLIDKEVRESFVSMQETNRMTRGLIDWLGYDTEYLQFHAKARIHGEAAYTTRKLVKLALNSVVSLSLLPLYISGYFGIFITTASFIAGLLILIENYILGDPLNWNISGSASLGVLILFLVGIVLISQGLIALYISRIYVETRGRPLYAINKAKSIL